MQKLCTAGLTGDGRTDGHHHHTFAPVDLTAPKVAAGKNISTEVNNLVLKVLQGCNIHTGVSWCAGAINRPSIKLYDIASLYGSYRNRKRIISWISFVRQGAWKRAASREL